MLNFREKMKFVCQIAFLYTGLRSNYYHIPITLSRINTYECYYGEKTSLAPRINDQSRGMDRSGSTHIIITLCVVTQSVIIILWTRYRITKREAARHGGQSRITTSRSNSYIQITARRNPAMTVMMLVKWVFRSSEMFISDQTIGPQDTDPGRQERFEIIPMEIHA